MSTRKLFVALLAAWWPLAAASGQVVVEVQATPGASAPVAVPPGAQGTVVAPASGPAAPPGAPADASKPADGKPADGKPADGKPAEAAADDSIQRPKTPPRAPDPREFDVRPDANARVQFNFHGQLWPDVLQWFASISGYSLDWQQLPSDFIHLSTNREMSLPEVRDLLNRLLFDRGYTMVLQGDVLLVMKVDKLDPSLLPRIDDEAELLDRPAHDFVKITFTLPEKLKADKAAEDVKPLLSPHAKVHPLMQTNRLLVIDLVANLREVSRLVNSEHAAAVGHLVPREFTIRFARAEQVADQVMILLGLDPSSRRTPEELQVEQQKIQLFAQMQQQGKDISKYLRGDTAPTIYLAVNPRSNSILANAPPDEMAKIERAVSLLDVPNGTLAGATTAGLTLKRYQLVTLKPEALVTTLQDIGELDPRTRLKTDTDARTVFAQATAADHEKIRAVVDHLDGTGRQFEVIWLRRLPADAVAATVAKLMAGQDAQKKENNDDYPFFYSFRRSRDRDEQPPPGFRVDADIENNRLLLWANDSELKEVRNFLAKLGEIPSDQGNPHTVRTLEPRDPEATKQLLEQLRRAWPAIGPNPLKIEVDEKADAVDGQQVPPREIKPQTPNAVDEARTQPGAEPAVPTATDAALSASTLPDTAWVLAQLSSDAPAATSTPSEPASDPVVVSVTPDGRIVISSRDTKALDQIEELIARIAPAAKDYEVFYLKHALASLVTLNLEEYFEEDKDAKSDEENWYRGWYGFDMDRNEKEATPGLNRRPKIRFIYDYDTNSILVSNASPEQLATVRTLIEVYDRPISEESVSARRFQIFKLRYARAEDVAETVKDVYRDLLSSKDKAFVKNQEQKEQSSQSASIYRIFGSSTSDENEKPKKVKATFSGALSVGVDAKTNTVIVSVQEEWLPSITEMIRFLDREAASVRPTVEVVNTRISPQSLQAALSRVLGDGSKQVQVTQPTTDGAKPPADGQGKPGGDKPAEKGESKSDTAEAKSSE